MKDDTTQLKKLTIVSIDDRSVEAKAMYNPKELTIDKTVPWQKHKSSKGDQPHLEFTAAEGRTLSLELLFDTFESGTSVQPEVAKLLRMAMLIDPSKGADEQKKRPHQILVVWGGSDQSADDPGKDKGFPTFKGVIESLSTKYTMFHPDGTPCRATCTLKIKEAERITVKVSNSRRNNSSSSSGGGGGGGTAPGTGGGGT